MSFKLDPYLLSKLINYFWTFKQMEGKNGGDTNKLHGETISAKP